jgi:hypothetical protein
MEGKVITPAEDYKRACEVCNGIGCPSCEGTGEQYRCPECEWRNPDCGCCEGGGWVWKSRWEYVMERDRDGYEDYMEEMSRCYE